MLCNKFPRLSQRRRLVVHLGCMVLCSFARLGCSACFRSYFECFVHVWTAQIESDIHAPRVACRNDLVVQEPLCLCFLLSFGCWSVLGHPSGLHRASKAERKRKQKEKGAPHGCLFEPLPLRGVTWVLVWMPWGAKRTSRRHPRAILWTS